MKQVFFGLVSLVAVSFFVFPSFAHAEFPSIPLSAWPSFNGTVHAVVPVSDGSAYAGGNFTAVGEDPSIATSSNFGNFNIGSSTIQNHVALGANGVVYASVSDAAGRWYIGGSFSAVQGTTRNGLARILANGSLDTTFDPNIIETLDGPAQGIVRSLALSSDGLTLYVGGQFDEVNGSVSRGNLAAFSTASTGTVTSFNRAAGSAGLNTVHALALSSNDDTLYVGGDFTYLYIEDIARNSVAAFSTAGTGSLLSFNPNINSGVSSFALSSDDSLLYVGGNFTNVNGVVSREDLAAFSTAATGTVTSFTAGIQAGESNINALALSPDDSILYVGGNFETVNSGVNRLNLAAVTVADGIVTSFNPTMFGGQVYALDLSTDGLVLYAGGQFTTVNGSVSRKGVASIATAATGTVSSFNASLEGSGYVFSLALSSSGSSLLVGGNFSISAVADGVVRNGIAHILANGTVDSNFNPNASGTVFALALSSDESTVYAGGNFTKVNGTVTRNRLAAFTTNGIVTGFNPDANGIVYALTLTSDDATLYVGGSFTSMNNGADVRNRIAAFNMGDNSVLSFNPNANNTVYALRLSSDESIIYVGGDFDSIGGASRTTFAALSTGTGLATSLQSNFNDSVRGIDISSDESLLYAGGLFTAAQRASTTKVGLFDSTSGVPTQLSYGADGVVEMVISDRLGGFYIAGQFTQVQGIERNFIAHILSDGTLDLNFNPNVDGAVYSIVLSLDGSTLYAGGEFNSVNGGGASRNYLAAFDTSATGTVTSFDPNLDNVVNAITLSSDGSVLYATGFFTLANGGDATRNYLAAFDTSATGTVTSFDPELDATGEVLLLSSDDQLLYVGGNFGTVNGNVTRNYLAAFDTSATGTVTIFDPNLDAVVYGIALSPDESTLYAGGEFSEVNIGIGRNYLAAFNTATGTVTNFDPNAGSIVYSVGISSDGSILYAGGDFLLVNDGVARNYFASFGTSATGTVTSFDPNLDSIVYTIAVGTSTVFAGGDFTKSFSTRNRVAALDLDSGTLTSFNPNLNGQVRDIILSGDDATLYAAGLFNQANEGVTRNGIAGFSTTNGTVTEFNPNANDAGATLVLNEAGTRLYAGGFFTTIGGDSEFSHFALFSSASSDVTAPVVTVLGENPMTIFRGSTYVESGATATDNVDGNLTGSIVTTGSVNTAVVGTYTITYTATDSSLNVGSETRTVFVVVDASESVGIRENPTSGGGGGGSGGGGSSTPLNPNDALKAQIALLLKQVADLQAQIAARTGGTIFTKNLKLGDIDPEVKLLQQYLNTHGFTVSSSGPGSSGSETTKFGALTKAALIQFQEAHAADILTPAGLSAGTGIFGQSTRAYVNAHR